MCKYFKENKKQTKALHTALMLQTKSKEGRGLQQAVCSSLSFCQALTHRDQGNESIWADLDIDSHKCKGEEGEWIISDLSKSLCE